MFSPFTTEIIQIFQIIRVSDSCLGLLALLFCVIHWLGYQSVFYLTILNNGQQSISIEAGGCCRECKLVESINFALHH
jgi:hypothetical protein